MTGEEILNTIFIRGSYEPPLSLARRTGDWPNLENPLHIAILLVDFDTELCMNGILGFLENSIGAHLDRTVAAFSILGDEITAAVLQDIQRVMKKHEVTHQLLRAPHKKTVEYQITSFSQLHGPSLDEFADEATHVARRLYIYDQSQQSPFHLLEQYAEKHSARILSEVQKLREQQGEL